MSDMTRTEREDLQRLIRQREKVLKSTAKLRSAELLADFENQMGQQYSFDQDEVWRKATEAADREVKKCQAQIEARCAELGIPQQFAPKLAYHWYSRGENAFKERRVELRKMATAQIEAIEKKAITEIELRSVEAQTQLAVAGLTSEAARSFVDKLPAIAVLMPKLSFAELAGEASPPVAGQLISPNAMRQRRYRERQALRDATSPLRNAFPGQEGGPATPLGAALDAISKDRSL
jgi:hypothetical protein